MKADCLKTGIGMMESRAQKGSGTSKCQDEGSGENKKMALYDFSSCPAIHSAPLAQPSIGQELTMWRELAMQASDWTIRNRDAHE